MGNLLINTGGIATNKEGMPSIDLRYGPYASLSAAHTALSTNGLCAVGLTVGIINGNKVDEYWYQEGIELINLVKKQSDVTIDAYTKQESDTKYQPKGNYQPAGNYATEQQLANKVDTEPGKGLSTNDYTNEEKQKVTDALVPADIAGKANTSDVYPKSETYNKEEVNNLITTPEQKYVNVTATDQTTAVTDLLPATGAADTTYRVGNWDGTQYNDSVFSEYAWNGTNYIKLNTKSQIGEVYDISANHADAKYADLAAALGTNGVNIPQSLRKGGMSVKFVQRTAQNTDKYVQYFLTKDEWSVSEGDWQKLNLEEEVSQLQQKVDELDKEINIGGRTDIRTIQGTSVNQFFSLSDLGYPTDGNTNVYFRVTNPNVNFEQYGLGQGNNNELVNYRATTWDDEEHGYGHINIQNGFSQLVVTKAVSAAASVTILSSQEFSSLKSRIASVENIMEEVNGMGVNQFFNLSDLGYPAAGNTTVYIKVINPDVNFKQYGLGQGNNNELVNYRAVTWIDEEKGFGYADILNGYSQLVVTSTVRTGVIVQILSKYANISIFSQLEKSHETDETLTSNISAVNGRISGGETTLRAINGNGADQIIPLSTLGVKRPSVYLYFRVSSQSANFEQYGLGYSEDGETLSTYASVTWVNQAEGYGYISVRNKDYVVLTSENNVGVSIRFVDVSWNPGIENHVLALNQRVYGGHRIVLSIEGNGIDQFIKLTDYGITPDENGRFYISVENPAVNFNQYGIATSDDGQTLKNYQTLVDDGDEKYFSGNTLYIAVTSAVAKGTRVSFYSRHEDGIGKVYNHPAIVSFVDDDSGKYVPSIWGQILSQSPIRMGFACITGYMDGLPAPENYEQMTEEQLKSLYDDGHEVYSHSYTHPAFYDSGVTVDQISDQCLRSKDWLLANGYFRGSNIIVYPGGLGDGKIDKENVVRRFYKYGVDTTGGGVNEEPLINKLRIKRVNADTATLDYLKAKVDETVASGHLLVFMNHAYELNRDAQTQIAKMVSLIEYIKETTALILPLGEALNQIYGI